jgi:chaperonin cofactor prefoldin
MSTGQNLLNAIDLIDNDKTLTRKIGDTCFTFKDNKVVLLNQAINKFRKDY